jgi:hypothetical protein
VRGPDGAVQCRRGIRSGKISTNSRSSSSSGRRELLTKRVKRRPFKITSTVPPAQSCFGPGRFPPPWSVEETQPCFIVRDANKQALAFVYCEDEPGRRAAASLLTRDEARRTRGQHRQTACARTLRRRWPTPTQSHCRRVRPAMAGAAAECRELAI